MNPPVEETRVFNHSAPTFSSALGLTDKEADALVDAVKNAAVNRQNRKNSQVAEEVLQAGLSVLEVLYVGFIIGQVSRNK